MAAVLAALAGMVWDTQLPEVGCGQRREKGV